MAIETHPTKPGLFLVRHTKRHPILRKPIDRKREARSLSEAKKIEKQLIIEVEEIIHRKVVPTWSKLLEDYLHACADRGLNKKTVYNDSTCLNAYTLPAWGNRLADSITTQEIRDLIQQRVGHRSLAHQKYILKCIRQVFLYGVEANAIMRNPTPQMKFKLGDKIKPVLTEEQARYLLSKAKELDWEWYPHYALALYTGMRNGELYALKKSNVDLDNRTILVNLSWNSKDGYKSTKSGDDRRIEVAKPLIPILSDLLAREESEFVLPRLDKWDKGEQARDLRIFLKGIGLPMIRFHDLRATWATILLAKGVEPIRVMKMGGWKDIETMMIYARKAGVDIRGATDVLDLEPKEEPRGAKILHLAEIL